TRLFFLFSTPSSTKLYPLSLHDALPIYRLQSQSAVEQARAVDKGVAVETAEPRELGMLQPGDHAEDAALLAMPELRLEADHVVRSEEGRVGKEWRCGWWTHGGMEWERVR